MRNKMDRAGLLITHLPERATNYFSFQKRWCRLQTENFHSDATIRHLNLLRHRHYIHQPGAAVWLRLAPTCRRGDARFKRSVELPAGVDPNKATAKFKKGDFGNRHSQKNRSPIHPQDQRPEKRMIARHAIARGVACDAARNWRIDVQADKSSALLMASQQVILLPIFAGRHAVEQLVGQFVVGDLAGGAVEFQLGVDALRDDPQGHGLAQRPGDGEG